MVGGKGESYANIGEGLATGLQCFEDLQLRREPNTASQKHCILICNSPPYQTMIQESYKFAGHTVEQIASIYQEVQYTFWIVLLESFYTYLFYIYIYFYNLSEKY
jgi:mediator of RNA polymerase II transcription subunit 25